MLGMVRCVVREYWRELLLVQVVVTCAYALLFTAL